LAIRRNNVDVSYPESKDGYIYQPVYDEVPLIIYIITNEYKEGIEIAQIVRTLLECKRGTYSGINITSCILNRAEEDKGRDGYFQILEFIIRCK